MKRIWALGLLTLVVAAIAEPPQIVFQRTDTQKEIEIGREAYDYWLRSGSLSANEAYVRRVQRVLDQLAAALPAKPYPFHAIVIIDRSFNARCYPGGYMLVHEGLLARLEQDEALAFILAHEMGHAVKRHWARTVRREQSDAVVDILGAILTKGNYVRPDRTYQYNAYSRTQEYESDAFGVELYLRAGYDPKKVTLAPDEMVVLDKKYKVDQVSEYELSHPRSVKRLAEIKKICEQLLAAGLKPSSTGEPVTVTLESVFGKLPCMTATGNALQPLEPGTTWTYRVGEGTALTTYEVRSVGVADVLTSKVARFEMRAGESVVPFQVLADDTGVYRRNRPDKPASQWAVETAFPTVEGSVEVAGTLFSYVGVEAVDCPAGKFDKCVCLSIEGKGRKMKVWFAPGIGMVKRVNETSGVTELLIQFRRAL
jgi:Zn-dependent protease with chaperone function